ncbi:hypothetical protein [Leucobacter triazinivorans]|uniref:Large exoprotein n=1 Tax=Leucobacter triazinivorans TaxID=1784719 RepID=A0A4P6KHQ0_9MICO|nr:hypothetical protein [Leucobacter triazinivorans]QBE49518.1 hypothetical protein EVS81_12310 [Leucobacter triazinivorans]
MTGGVLGGGVIFVIAALLWAAVLVPAWIRRREFRAAERNAARLQRTLRVLAETSEVPREVHLEATARQALAQEKLLRTARKRQEAERQAELAEARAVQVRAEIQAQRMQRTEAAIQRSARLRRPAVRRLRALAALGALVGLVGALVGLGFAVAGSGVAVLVWGGFGFCASLGALVLLAPGRVRVDPISAEQVEPVAPMPDVAQPSVASEADDAASAAHAAAQLAAAARIERARALARSRAERPTARENQPDSMLLREAERDPATRGAAARAGAGAVAAAGADPAPSADRVQPARAEARTGEPKAGVPATPRRAPAQGPTAQERAARERLRQMGVIGDTSAGMPDLDAVLRRRRNAS